MRGEGFTEVQLVGGILDGWVGDHPKSDKRNAALFGPPDFKNFLYRQTERKDDQGREIWEYDAKMSTALIRDEGIRPLDNSGNVITKATARQIGDEDPVIHINRYEDKRLYEMTDRDGNIIDKKYFSEPGAPHTRELAEKWIEALGLGRRRESGAA